MEELKGSRNDKCDENDHCLITTQVQWQVPWESHENCGCLGYIEDSKNHQTTVNDSNVEVRTEKHTVCTRENKDKQKEVKITKEDQSFKPV